MTKESLVLSECDKGSTGTMLRQMLLTPENTLICKLTANLLIEQEPSKATALRSLILSLMKTRHVDLLTPFQGTNVLISLLRYYKKTSLVDTLLVSLRNFYFSMKFINLCEALFKKRWNEDLIFKYRYFQKDNSASMSQLNEAIEINLHCRNLAEAALAANMLESVLYENHQIRFRSMAKYFSIMFSKSDDVTSSILMRAYYQPDDYTKVTDIPHQLLVKDEQLMQTFLDQNSDFTDYCRLRYQTDDHHMLDSRFAALGLDTDHDFSAELLIITRTGLGSGNFINARTTIEGLCSRLPQLKINWIVANDGDRLPTTAPLSPNVSFYETDALWKVYPLIQSLSLNADAVISLPNYFLIVAERELPDTLLTLSEKSVLMVVTEYNTSYEPGLIPEQYLDLHSGIRAGDKSLGLLKPTALTLAPSLDEKRHRLCEDQKAAHLFTDNPTAPLYMAYAYCPRAGVTHAIIQGLKLMDILALFIQHAKYSSHKNMKAVLPIDQETIEEAIKTYPNIFAGCTICYVDSTNLDTPREKMLIGDGADLYVEIFHLFPFENTTFRLLMDYCTAHDLPVVVTGDQSFMELFFTMTEGFVFLYQMLEHKKELFMQIKSIAANEHLSALEELINKTEHSINSEEELIGLTAFLKAKQDELKTETLALMSIIKAERNLVDSFAKIIVDRVTQKRLDDSATTEPSQIRHP